MHAASNVGTPEWKQVVDGSLILAWIIKKGYLRMCAEFMCVTIGNIGRLCKPVNRVRGVTKGGEFLNCLKDY